MELGALEAGGEKMVCSVGDETGKLFDRMIIPTTTPEETLPKIVDFFRGRRIVSLGIGSFGPLDLDPESATYGYIMASPKKHWTDCPLLPILKTGLGVPAAIDTGINAAALAEYRLGAGQNTDNMVALSCGIGVGGGLVIDGKIIHGLVHPEMGHIILKPHPEDPTPRGFCQFHESCAEGLASGPSMEARWGISPRALPADHKGWKIEAYYLAQMCANTISMISPEKIILGGGVLQHEGLIDLVRQETIRLLGGYVASPMALEHIDQLIVEPGLGMNSGVIGALLMAVDVA